MFYIRKVALLDADGPSMWMVQAVWSSLRLRLEVREASVMRTGLVSLKNPLKIDTLPATCANIISHYIFITNNWHIKSENIRFKSMITFSLFSASLTLVIRAVTLNRWIGTVYESLHRARINTLKRIILLKCPQRQSR